MAGCERRGMVYGAEEEGAYQQDVFWTFCGTTEHGLHGCLGAGGESRGGETVRLYLASLKR